MKRVVKLTESDLNRIIRQVIKENDEFDGGGLDYIDSHWDKYKNIAHNISKKLPDMRTGDEREIGKHLRVRNFSELGDSWNVKDLYGISTTLNALAEKLTHMMFTGKGDSIKPMLKSIVERGIKTQYRYKNKKGNPEWDRGSLGKGHFIWDFRTYTLNPKEIKKIKEFFNL